MDEICRQQFAIRSFTESVEMDTPPCLSESSIASTAASEVEEEYDDEDFMRNTNEGPMKSSSTVDTIIEVVG